MISECQRGALRKKSTLRDILTKCKKSNVKCNNMEDKNYEGSHAKSKPISSYSTSTLDARKEQSKMF